MSSLPTCSTRGIIPASAVRVPGAGGWKKKKAVAEAGEASAAAGDALDSDDEEIDKAALKSGELEG